MTSIKPLSTCLLSNKNRPCYCWLDLPHTHTHKLLFKWKTTFSKYWSIWTQGDYTRDQIECNSPLILQDTCVFGQSKNIYYRNIKGGIYWGKNRIFLEIEALWLLYMLHMGAKWNDNIQTKYNFKGNFFCLNHFQI